MATPVFKKIATSDVKIGWSWEDESKGLIKWSFNNEDTKTRQVILYRNGYYFGNAFWAVYENNPEFNTKFVTDPKPLMVGDQAPLFVAKMNGKYIVALLFTLGQDSTYEMTEGGFVDGMKPEDYKLYDVTDGKVQKMSIGYDESQITQWDEQSDTNYTGYEPNPQDFNVFVGNVDAPFVELYPDKISPVTTITTPTGTPKTPCRDYERQMITAVEHFDFIEAIEAMVDYLRCVENEHL